jgi:hypothetical protein
MSTTNIKNQYNKNNKNPPKGNYWVKTDRNNETYLRFAHINPNRVFDVFVNHEHIY